MEKPEVIAPPVVTGWLRKQGRKGLIKNWKKRYFVLKYGKLSYFEDEAKQFPLGVGLKGELNLMNTELELQEDHGKQQIYIVAFNGENSLLIETDTEAETNRWTNALKHHIRFANKSSVQQTFTFKSAASPTSPETSTIPVAAPVPINSPADEVDSDDDVTPSPNAPSSTNDITISENENSPSSREETISKTIESTNNQNLSPGKSTSVQDVKTEIHSADKLNNNPQLVVNRIIDNVQRFIVDKEFRQGILQSAPTKARNIFEAAKTHFLEGNFGERGEEYVVSIVCILGIILFGAADLLILLLNLVLSLCSPVLWLGGWLLIGHAMWELETRLSFWLRPCHYSIADLTGQKSKDHKVVTTGAYSVVRHPMYTGLLCIALGVSIWSNSVLKMSLTLVLTIVLVLAANEEEKWLLQLHPKDYARYSKQTPRCIIPFVY
jgi:protein-S-isoprenylcysteine O-methyltransferase Ste14